MGIELLYFRGCPHGDATRARLEEVLREEGLPHAIHSIDVQGDDEAARHQFIGSPSVRINGVDVDPAARTRSEWALGCRLYGGSGVPPKHLLRAAVREAGRSERADR
ncbi:MAG: hypothetical protein HKP27_17245 [Myxococcales bacterium]|nr:hypothetical protein [Myxococcales bacterium]